MSIGVFDSGVGGLSVWRDIARELARTLPDEDLVYFADQANVPYGVRPLDDIRALTLDAVNWLIERGCDEIVIACNTASAAALSVVRATFPHTPIVGMEPAVKPAAAATRSGVIGVTATEATLKAERFAQLVERFASGLTVIEQPCPDWVAFVEHDEGDRPRDDAATIFDAKVWPLLDADADTLVLGCTHFPFARNRIEASIRDWNRATGARREVALIDPSPAVARQAIRVRADLRAAHAGRQRDFFTSGDAQRFRAQISRLLNFDAPVWRTSIGKHTWTKNSSAPFPK